jgi:hypothetical protein
MVRKSTSVYFFIRLLSMGGWPFGIHGLVTALSVQDILPLQETFLPHNAKGNSRGSRMAILRATGSSPVPKPARRALRATFLMCVTRPGGTGLFEALRTHETGLLGLPAEQRSTG